MKGRKPKPTAIKKLAGNPGRRPLNDAEPQLPVGGFSCPGYLNEIARKEWRRVIKDLRAAGVLSRVDRAALEGYCLAYSTAVAAQKEIQERGLLIEGSHGGTIRNPATSILNQSLLAMARFMAELGMTPSSRTRIKIEQPQEKRTLAEILFEDVAAKGQDG